MLSVPFVADNASGDFSVTTTVSPLSAGSEQAGSSSRTLRAVCVWDQDRLHVSQGQDRLGRFRLRRVQPSDLRTCRTSRSRQSPCPARARARHPRSPLVVPLSLVETHEAEHALGVEGGAAGLLRRQLTDATRRAVWLQTRTSPYQGRSDRRRQSFRSL